MKRHFILSIKYFLLTITIFAALHGKAFDFGDSSNNVVKQQALQYLSSLPALSKSSFWPNVEPATYLSNLKKSVEQPLSIYEGRGTNFCGYAALSYIPLNYDPLNYSKFMMELYTKGRATLGKVNFKPSPAVMQAAGTLKFKGKLDLRPADQVWFLILADHFKGYLNIINSRYDAGDEDGFWASTNYAKFNRMIRKMFNQKVDAQGADIIRPHVKNLVPYLKEKIQTGTTFLYLNNTFLTKKKHGFKLNLPTHFVVLLDITENDDRVQITFWDYGGRTLQEVTKPFLKKILFGISHCTPN